MLKSFLKYFLVAGISSLMGSSLFAANYSWIGGTDNNYFNAANWNAAGNNNYGVTDIIQLDNAGVIAAAPNTIISGVCVDGTGSAANAPVLTITSSVATNAGWVSIGELPGITAAGPGDGIIYQTSGTITNAYLTSIGINVAAYSSSSAQSSGTYNFGGTSAGTAPSFVASVNGGNPGQNGILIGGGGNGVMNLSGYGTIATQGTWYGIAIGNDRLWSGRTQGSGLLSITGGNLSITTSNFYMNGANSILSDTIDSTGISTIFSTGTAGGINGGVWIGSGSVFQLKLGTGFSASLGQVFTIISTAGTVSGTFSNLANGGVYTVSGYSFLALYGNSVSNDSFTLKVTGIPGNYAHWLATYTLPPDVTGSGALTACPAGDGIANVMKYGLGLNPFQPGYAGHFLAGTTTSGSQRYLAVTYTQPNPAPTGIAFSVEQSSDLATWSAGGVQVSNTTTGAFQTIMVRDTQPLGGGVRRSDSSGSRLS